MTVIDLYPDWGVPENECPKCNTELSTRSGMEQHFPKVHNTKIGFAVVRCDQCGSVERRNRTHTEASDTHLCSVECESKWKENKEVTEDHNFWKGGKNAYACDYCSDTVMKFPSVAEQAERNFCDEECHRKWQSECRPSEEHNWWKGGPVSVECAECDSDLERKPALVKERERFFCSKECEAEWKVGRNTGEDHPNWKGGVKMLYGRNWPEQRRKRREYDDHQCVVCSMSNEEHKEVNGCQLHVHHIQPASTFLIDDRRIDYKRANRLENLITLCYKCHNRWEGIPLRPEVNGQ